MARQRDLRPPLMVRVWTELGRGDIKEKWLESPSLMVHGQLNGHRVEVNPAIEVVDTVVHELLHRMFPQWSEAYVRNRTTYLLRRMTNDEFQAFYREYLTQVGKE